MKKILYIDDDATLLNKFAENVRERFPGIEPVISQDPVKALSLIEPSLSLLIIDLEMPTLDGRKLLNYAIERGVDRKKIIIISSHEADYLHKIIPMGECLCVLNKNDVRQREVLDMVLASLQKK